MTELSPVGSWGAAERARWPLDPSLSYLNHGTVGVAPLAVLDERDRILREIERDPAQALLRELADIHATGDPELPRLRAALGPVAEFVGCDVEGLVFVDNITAGANAVVQNFAFEAGDEIVVTSLAYGGVRNAVEYAARRSGAKVVTAEMPPIGAAPETFVDAVSAVLGPRTRMAVVDHLAAHAALLMPIAEIASACRARGIPILVDGAHVPGGVALDIASLGVDWYAANLHKWAWTPRSVGILWAAPEHREALHAPVISWGLDNGIAAEFDWPGTRDPTPYLSTPFALEQLAAYGIEHVFRHNHDLAWWAAQHLSDRWGTAFHTPESMIGQIVAVRLPSRFGTGAIAARALQARLRRDLVEVSLSGDTDPTCLTMRLSGQVYVDRAEIEAVGNLVAGY